MAMFPPEFDNVFVTSVIINHPTFIVVTLRLDQYHQPTYFTDNSALLTYMMDDSSTTIAPMGYRLSPYHFVRSMSVARWIHDGFYHSSGTRYSQQLVAGGAPSSLSSPVNGRGAASIQSSPPYFTLPYTY